MVRRTPPRPVRAGSWRSTPRSAPSPPQEPFTGRPDFVGDSSVAHAEGPGATLPGGGQVPADTTEDVKVARSAVVAHRASAGVLEQACVTSVPADPCPPRQRLAGLDGVRGLAALFVVVNHVFLRAFPGYPVDRAPFWAAWFIYGRFAVVVFIVLSGFSLALSPARRDWDLGGVSRFAQRRVRRILPAYWAALVFSLAV